MNSELNSCRYFIIHYSSFDPIFFLLTSPLMGDPILILHFGKNDTGPNAPVLDDPIEENHSGICPGPKDNACGIRIRWVLRLDLGSLPPK